MELVQYKEYIIKTVDTDCLVFYQWAVCNHSVEYAPMYFQLFMG